LWNAALAESNLWINEFEDGVGGNVSRCSRAKVLCVVQVQERERIRQEEQDYMRQKWVVLFSGLKLHTVQPN